MDYLALHINSFALVLVVKVLGEHSNIPVKSQYYQNKL